MKLSNKFGSHLLTALTLAFLCLLIAPASMAAEAEGSKETAQPPAEAEEHPMEEPLDFEKMVEPQVQLAEIVCFERCDCEVRQTPPTSRVGATCLRARQNAAAAARTFAVCAPGERKCGPTNHTVAPCQALPTGGFRATAVATYRCEVCYEICRDLCRDPSNA